MGAIDDRYNYNRFGSKGQRVGQAVLDILSVPQPVQTVGDVLDSFGKDFAKEMEETINSGMKIYSSPFYVFVLTKKEFWADNVLRNYFIARQTPPHAFEMMGKYSNYTKTLYMVDGNQGNVRALWSLPSYVDCVSIAKRPDSFDPELVKWVENCFRRKLDKDSYSWDWDVWQ